METAVKVKGMSCQHCVMAVTKSLQKLEGVRNVRVDLERGEVRFDNPNGVEKAKIEKAVIDAGFEVVPA